MMVDPDKLKHTPTPIFGAYYRAKLHRFNELLKLAGRGLTDEERAEMDALALELEEMELAASTSDAGALGGAL